MTFALYVLIATNWILIVMAVAWLWWLPRLVVNTVAEEIRRQDDRIRKARAKEETRSDPGTQEEALGMPAGTYPPQHLEAGRPLRRS